MLSGWKIMQKKKIQPSNTRNKREPTGDICQHANVLWLNKEKLLTAAKWSLSKHRMRAYKPLPKFKAFSEVLHTNWEENESLSFENCWAALSIKYYLLQKRSNMIYSVIASTVKHDHRCKWTGRSRQALGAVREETHHLPPTRAWEQARKRETQHIGFSCLCLVLLLQRLLPQSELPG